MTNTELAWRIHDGLKQAGIDIGAASVELVKLLIDDAEAERWTPVSERLPELQVDVLVTDGSRREIANYAPYCATPSWPYEWFATGKALIMNVTHWQPLPGAPEREATE